MSKNFKNDQFFDRKMPASDILRLLNYKNGYGYSNKKYGNLILFLFEKF